MKLTTDRPFANIDAAVNKLLELANWMEGDYAGRLNVGVLNIQFKEVGGSYTEYDAAVKAAIARALHHASVRRLCDVHASRRGLVRVKELRQGTPADERSR
jgi:hypothetical protein